MPPLAWLQQKLYAGENQLTYDTLSSIACLRELQVLNLSCNDIQDMPSSFFRDEVGGAISEREHADKHPSALHTAAGAGDS